MLTPSAEEYLEAIYRLGGQNAFVHLSKLAETRGLSAASVNEMVRRLEIIREEEEKRNETRSA